MGYLEILHDDLPDDKEEIKKRLNLALESSKNIADVMKQFQNARRYVTTEYADCQPMLDIKKVSSIDVSAPSNSFSALSLNKV